MRTPSRATTTRWLLWLPATILLAGCAGMNTPSLTGPTQEPPAIQPDQIVGRWGLAAYQREEDRTRTIAEARSQCRQAYPIERGPNGGVIMHLADSSEAEELRLKGLTGGRTFVGPEGEANDPRDREIISFDGKIMVMRWVDAEVAARYGTSVYVRCEGPPPRTVKKRKSRPKAKAAPPPPQATPPEAPRGPVFMPPPTSPPPQN